LGNAEDAEDALQMRFFRRTAMCRALRTLQVFDMANPYRSECGAHAATPSKAIHMASLDATSSEHDVPMSERAQDDDPNPEQLFAHTELREMMRGTWRTIVPLFTAFVLCGVEEYTHEEAARRLGITVTAMKARMHRARYKLRRALGPHFKRRRGM